MTQRSDADEARTRGPSVSTQAHYICTTKLLRSRAAPLLFAYYIGKYHSLSGNAEMSI